MQGRTTGIAVTVTGFETMFRDRTVG